MKRVDKNHVISSIFPEMVLVHLNTSLTTNKLILENYQLLRNKEIAFKPILLQTRWEFASKPSERPTHS